MTVIALLNVENDPHLVADTLLTSAGRDRSETGTILLPAVGTISTQWGTEKEPWFITRLARKSMVLPDATGILAFANGATRAHEFWTQYSDRYSMIRDYELDRKFDRRMLEDALDSMNMPRDLDLLGLCGPAGGERQFFAYGDFSSVQTDNLGTCYFAGTGSDYLRSVVLDADQAWRIRKPRNRSITAEVAEHISSRMLYAESDPLNGHEDGSPLSKGFGGYFEWYALSSAGVYPQKERIDLHFRVEGDRLLAMRAYVIGNLTPIAGAPFPHIAIVSLIIDPLVVQRDGDCWAIETSNLQLSVIEPAFLHYERQADSNTFDRLYGQGDGRDVEQIYGNDHEFRRVRTIVASDHAKNAISDGFVAAREDHPHAVLETEGNKTRLRIGPEVMATVQNRVGRLKS